MNTYEEVIRRVQQKEMDRRHPNNCGLDILVYLGHEELEAVYEACRGGNNQVDLTRGTILGRKIIRVNADSHIGVHYDR